MFPGKFICAAILVTLVGLDIGQMSTVQKQPVRRTSPVSGAEMYKAYCASCHGQQGKGDGPAAPALKAVPTDLTTLAKKNNGRFPDGQIYQVIKWGGTVAAHGSREMPVWSTALRSVSAGGEAEVEMRIKNLIQYIESLQVK